MKENTVTIPLYGGDFTMIQTSDMNAVKDKFELEDFDACEAFVFEKDDENGFKTIYAVFDIDVTIPFIAHEAVHVTDRICKSVGFEPDVHNNEPYAYLLEWVVETCLKYVKVK